MTTPQRLVLVIAGCAITLMVLYPPYVAKGIRGLPVKSGYAFLFNLPAYTYESQRGPDSIPSVVNIPQLGIQITGVLVACGLLYLASSKTKPKNEMPRNM